MFKSKKDRIYKPLVATGYILFSLLAISVLASTIIPFSSLLSHPGVRYGNVIFITIALTLGALMPWVIGYYAGDRSVRSKSEISRHFNGVLLGLLAYWITTICNFIPMSLLQSSSNLHTALVNALPIASVAVITSAIAISHRRSKAAKHDLIEYKPFSLTLITLAVAVPIVLSLPLSSGTLWGELPLVAFTPIAAVVSIWLLSYFTLHKHKMNTLARHTWVAVSVSVLFVITFVTANVTASLPIMLSPFNIPADNFIMTYFASWAIAVIGWAFFWYIQLKRLR